MRPRGWLRLWCTDRSYGPGICWKPAVEEMLFSERNGYVWTFVLFGRRWLFLPIVVKRWWEWPTRDMQRADWEDQS